MPAGITYWQKGTFRLYHHNPPLVKLVAALPVLWAKPIFDPVYAQDSWQSQYPDQATFAHTFAYFNAARYFELFQLARLPMPLFSIVGGLAVFAWSRRLYGTLGGLLSLTLWVFCPNILAHTRLITTDIGSTAIGVAATYVFWRYLHQPNWRLGVRARGRHARACPVDEVYDALAICSLAIYMARAARACDPESRLAVADRVGFWARLLGCRTEHHDARRGLFLRGSRGFRSGNFRFGSKAAHKAGTARHVAPALQEPVAGDDLAVPHVNRLQRGLGWESFPVRFPSTTSWAWTNRRSKPRAYPNGSSKRSAVPTRTSNARMIAHEREIPESSTEERAAYPVYLNGELKRTGWWYYYLLTLVV